MHSSLFRGIAGAILIGLAGPAAAVDFTQMNLVTDDQSAHAAQITDPALKNAWGVSFSPTSPFWVSAADGGVSAIYSVNPLTQATTKAGLTVTVPGNPTGQVFNGSTGFNGDRFLFVSEDGAIFGWRNALGTVAETLVVASSANSYKGAAIGSLSGNSYLYASNLKAGTIDVLKGTAAAPNLTGSFTDPGLPSGYAPFNVQNLGDTLYVTYAFKDDPTSDEETKGAGLGLVDAYDLNGVFLGRIATGGTLDAPWGLAIAPSSFGAWAGSLLVGNFGDGRINAFDAATHSFLGQVTGSGGVPLSIDGLWALTPGNGGSGGSTGLLYFSAGPDDEEHGLFGVLAAVPEPSTYAMMLLGLACVGALASRRR
jgi:uncharacterized protein (TIGR03118 family)